MIKVKTDYNKTCFHKIAVAASDVLGVAGEAIVYVDFASEEEIRQLNLRTRGIDKSTDVLSYPYIEKPDLPFTEANYPGDYNPKQKAVELGCIAICKPYIEKAAAEDDTVYIDDVYRAFAHGILHLMGFDHMTDAEYDAMHETENKIMKMAGVLK